MSDPVSNAEIEDVLSSIRRLVSVEDRADTQADDARDTSETMAADPSQGGAGDRLMLTPALRVDDRDSAPQTDADSQGDADHPGDANADQDQSDDGSEAQELRFSHSDYDRAWQDTADETAERQSTDEADSTGADDSEQADNAPYVLDQTQAADPLDAPGLGGRIAEVEAAVAARHDQWEPDGESDDAYAGGSVSPMAWEDYGPEPTYDDADGDELTGDASDIADDTETPGAQTFGETDDHRVDAGDQTAGASAGGTSATTSDDSDEETLWDDDRVDTVIDEEALRDMVSEIVRQELQGALGERITRNVRKLVRREIHRALSSHELD